MVRRARSAGDDVVDGVAGVQPEDTDLGDAIVYIYVDAPGTRARKTAAASESASKPPTQVPPSSCQARAKEPTPQKPE